LIFGSLQKIKDFDSRGNLKWNLLTINPVSGEGLDFKVRLRVGYRVITQFTSTGLVEQWDFFSREPGLPFKKNQRVIIS
jgi:hypothetical protein